MRSVAASTVAATIVNVCVPLTSSGRVSLKRSANASSSTAPGLRASKIAWMSARPSSETHDP